MARFRVVNGLHFPPVRQRSLSSSAHCRLRTCAQHRCTSSKNLNRPRVTRKSAFQTRFGVNPFRASGTLGQIDLAREAGIKYTTRCRSDHTIWCCAGVSPQRRREAGTWSGMPTRREPGCSGPSRLAKDQCTPSAQMTRRPALASRRKVAHLVRIERACELHPG